MSDSSQAPSSRSFWLSTIGIIGCFLIFVIILSIAYVPARPERIDPAANLSDEDRIAANLLTPAERKTRLEGLRTQENRALDAYEWLDRENGVVRLPIRRAMNLVIQEYSEGEGTD